MRVEMPEEADSEEIRDVRAEALRVALTHAATDASMQLQMMLGEAYRDYVDAVSSLREKIEAMPRLADMARQWSEDDTIILRGVRSAHTADIQIMLLRSALADVPRGTAEIGHGGTES